MVRVREPRSDLPASRAGAGSRPVLLVTLGVLFDPSATEFAVDAAVESGAGLIVANVTKLEPLPLSLMLGYDALAEFTPEVSEAVSAPAKLARSLGVPVERLRVRSPRPAEAVLDLAAERLPSLLVFGPDRAHLRPRFYRKVAQAIRTSAKCLVWMPE